MSFASTWRRLSPPHPPHFAHPLTHPPDDAFAAEHIPDMGHDLKEFRVFHWKLQGWKKLGKELTSSEFDCGGHKWCVRPLSDDRRLSHLHNPKLHLGGYSSSRSAMLFPQMALLLSISIMSTPKAWKGIGTLAPNSHWPSQTLTIPPFIPSTVCSSQLEMLSPNL